MIHFRYFSSSVSYCHILDLMTYEIIPIVLTGIAKDMSLPILFHRRRSSVEQCFREKVDTSVRAF